MPRVTDETRILTDRTVARYRLAELLTREQFDQATLLAARWFREGVINSEDHEFVRGIIQAAANQD